MKKILALFLTGILTTLLTACGGDGQAMPQTQEQEQSETESVQDTETAPNDEDDENEENTVETVPEEDETVPETLKYGEITVCLGTEPESVDPAQAADENSGTVVLHLFQGLAGWRLTENGILSVAADAAETLPEGVKQDDGSVIYTYTLREGLKWSDGSDVTAEDYVYAWQRAAAPDSGADFGYLFDAVQGYGDMWETDETGNFSNPDAQLSIETPDERTIQVTLREDIPYWNQLLAHPVFLPVQAEAASDDVWAFSPETFVGNGPYLLKEWDAERMILEKNPDFIDADTVDMEQIVFVFSDNENEMLRNFQDGVWQMIDQVPAGEIAALNENNPSELVTAGQMGTYFLCWNVNTDLLPESSELTGADAERARAEIRKAVSRLIDRNTLVNEIAQGGQIPAASYVAAGITNPDGTQFCETAGHSDSYTGYYDVSPQTQENQRAEALEILRQYYGSDEDSGMLTDFPVLTYLYNTGEGHQAVGTYLKDTLSGFGIPVETDAQEWTAFVEARGKGEFTIARNGLLSDCDDPVCFLELWTTASAGNDVQFGRGAHISAAVYSLDLSPYGYDVTVENGTWADTYDVLIHTAKACQDPEIRNQLLHLAEDQLMSTGCIIPLYFYTDLYMISSHVDGFYANPLGMKYFRNCTIHE